MKRVVIIGDVHGCPEEAGELLRICGHGPGDDVVFVGDLVGRGPDSRGVIDLVRKIGARSVMGNHEHAWLAYLASKESSTTSSIPSLLGPEQIRAAMDLSQEHRAFLRQLPLYLHLPEHRVVVVHAGVVPGVPLQEQQPEMLLNIRTVLADGTGSDDHFQGVPWGSVWSGPETIVFGHHARRGLQRHPFAIGIDTGCVYGGRLTAFILPERELVSVPARKVYVRHR